MLDDDDDDEVDPLLETPTSLPGVEACSELCKNYFEQCSDVTGITPYNATRTIPTEDWVTRAWNNAQPLLAWWAARAEAGD